MENLSRLQTLLCSLSNDDRISVWHMAIVVAILQCSEFNIFHPSNISRSRVMKLSRISALGTYHKCIKELVEFGYINYSPSYHPANASTIYFYCKHKPMI